MASTSTPATTRTIRAITNPLEQETETYRYWQSRTTAERMAAIDQIIRDSYAAKGIDVDVQRSDRSIGRMLRHEPPFEAPE